MTHALSHLTRPASRVPRLFSSRWSILAGAGWVVLLAGLPGLFLGFRLAAGNGPRAGKIQLQFWHTRTGRQEKALQAICVEYGRAHPGVEILPQYQGGYNDLGKKIRASILSRSLPQLAVAYESNVTEYMANHVVRPLDGLVGDPKLGFTRKELADIPAQYLASNRYPHFKGQLLSFPFTKSNLVMYYNRSLLRKGGFSKPPATWEEFEQQAAAVTRQIRQPAYAFAVDASTLDGMIYSRGGGLLAADGRHTLFDRPPAVKALEMLQRMARAKTLVVVDGNELGQMFASQRCALLLGTSAGLENTESLVRGKFDWDVAVLPHAAGVKPVTVMYGPNVCIFKSTPDQEREAWEFVKFFTSPAITARWSRETGYLPVRRSAIALPEMKAFYQQNPRAWHVYQILPMARPEPNVIGWQEVRKHLEDAARSVAGTGTTAVAAAVELKRKADQALAQSRQP